MRYVLIVLVGILFLGCSARYEVRNEYKPSSKQGFSECIQGCKKEKLACEKSAEANYQKCLGSAYERAKEISDDALREYDSEYERYLVLQRDYRYFKDSYDRTYNNLEADLSYFSSTCKAKKERYSCDRAKEIQIRLDTLKKEIPAKPKEPQKPIFSQILSKQQNYCRKDDSCAKDFDICYIGCGGEVVPYRLCVANCD